MHISLLILALLLNTLVRTALSFPDGSPTPSWQIDLIDSAGDVGQYASIAASRDGTTYISYYDATHAKLRVAYDVGENGNCGPFATWRCETVDNSEGVGQFSAIAINPRTNQPVIAYRDAPNGDLKLATAQCQITPSRQCAWNSRVVDDGGENNANEGQYISLAIDGQGRPHIAYYEAAPPDPACETLCFPFGSVKHATPATSGGNCGGGAWHCTIVDGFIGTGLGQYASLALGSNQRPSIAYYDAGRLKLATSVGSNGSCSYNAAWNCNLIDGGSTTGGAGIGKYVALTIDAAAGDRYHIAYYDEVNQTLKYATNDGSDTCRISGWRCTTIDAVGALTAERNISIVSYAAEPRIAYHSHAANGTLRFAQPTAAAGNCGEGAWHCATIDGGATTVGQFPALVGNGGTFAIAYYAASSGDLRLATTRFLQFLPHIRNE